MESKLVSGVKVLLRFSVLLWNSCERPEEVFSLSVLSQNEMKVESH